jgi:hypothetical protein
VDWGPFTMYVRVKRAKQTFFLHVEPTETVLEVKQKVQQLTEQPVEDQRLFLDGVRTPHADFQRFPWWWHVCWLRVYDNTHLCSSTPQALNG